MTNQDSTTTPDPGKEQQEALEEVRVTLCELWEVMDAPPKAKILEMIAHYQGIQKHNPPTSEAWKDASERLTPLFKLMTRIQS